MRFASVPVFLSLCLALSLHPALFASETKSPSPRKQATRMDTATTLQLKKNVPAPAPGNIEVTLVELVVKSLPPDRRGALMATLEFHRGTDQWNARIMARDRWVAQDGFELRLMDGQPEKGTVTIEIRPLPVFAEVQVSGAVLHLAKVGEAGRLPGREAYGEPEYERSIRSEAGDRILLYLLIPSRFGESALSYRVKNAMQVLPPTRLIFRQPDSPKYTYLIVDPASPGILQVKTRDGPSVDYPLAEQIRILESSPVHKNREVPDGFPITEMPANLD